MENRFQNDAPKSDAIGQIQQNIKRSSISINVGVMSDVFPRLDHYRISRRAKRPSLGALHNGDAVKDANAVETGQVGNVSDQQHHVGIKLGWIQGVCIPCLLNIWGVMLFLRLPWIVAQAGILQTIGIIGLSSFICFITTLSLSAISSNGEVKGGGVYFMMSRSLGSELGTSVGIVFMVANIISASMNTIGFCDSLNDLLKANNLKIIDNGINDVRIVGIMALVVMSLICAIGMEWESKAQNFLIVIIIGAILNFVIGTIMGPQTEEQIAKGFIGFSADVFKENLGSDYRYSENNLLDFFSVFAIFFPSVTGIQAGANISGDLKNPARNIPFGTLLALLISMLSYLMCSLFAGGAALRDAGGFENGIIVNCTPGVNCTYGLHNSYQVMQLMSLWAPLMYAGCFAATLSTAMTNVLSVPRLIQAMGRDGLFPFIYLSKGYGKAGEPYRAYVLTFIIAAIFLLPANLNAVAPYITNFFLASYALMNLCTFHAELVRPLGWRPSFKYYNIWQSLLGFILCVVIMFLINWETLLITIVIILVLYLIVLYSKPNANWGSSMQAQVYRTTISYVHKMNSINEHVKNYAPKILALTGPPAARPALIHLANLITKNSLLIVGEVFSTRLPYRLRSERKNTSISWLEKQDIKSFYHLLDGFSLERGATALMKTAGMGNLTPNVVLLGYKTHWSTCSHRDLQEYFNIIHNVFDNKLAAAILRIPEGLDCSQSVMTIDEESNGDDDNGVLAQNNYNNLAGNTLTRSDSNDTFMSSQMTIPRIQSVSTIDTSFVTPDTTSVIEHSTINWKAQENIKQKKRHAIDKLLKRRNGRIASTPENLTIFQKEHKKGTIDVWWLYDDGGLTILLPYIINMRSNWKHCKMRLFALTDDKQDINTKEKEMIEIMNKIRIDYRSLKVVDDTSVELKQETQTLFDKLISDFRVNDSSENSGCYITDNELHAQRHKTHQQLRLRQLLLENSSQSTLVVMSLPIPRRGAVSAPLYMAWLEVLTRDMPPTILVRGNQTSVVTVYS